MKKFFSFLSIISLCSTLSLSVAFADDHEETTEVSTEVSTEDETSIIEPIYDVVDEFTDVEEDHMFIVAIEYVFDEGLVNGNPDGTFAPDSTLNRAEMLKILVLAAGADQVEIDGYADEECFDDVPAGEWFTPYVCYGKEMGYVKGYGDGTFRPAADVTFVEGTKIAYEAFGLEWVEMEAPNPWYKELIVSATASSYSPTTITDFNQKLLRGEMADMTTRIHADLASETGLADYLVSLGAMGELKVTYDSIRDGEAASADEVEEEDTEATDDTSTDDNDDVVVENVINISAEGFDVPELSVLIGSVVTFVNIDTQEHWPASNAHPDHTDYPGTDNASCGGEEVMFDSCAGIAPGESWAFTFNEEGTWSYHDHLNSSFTGTIVVNGIVDPDVVDIELQ